MVPRLSRREATTRPRVEGNREQEILDATLAVLVDVGYDRLTMDAVATKAKASKATLYRRWEGKAALVIDALMSQKTPLEVPTDTGSLRGDLLAVFCAAGGLTDQVQTAILGSVVTAISRDAEFAAAFRARFIAPKVDVARQIYERAHDRGELRDDLDLEILSAALPGIVLHRMFLLGEPSTPELIARVVDQVILPAATRG
ncbi:TetR family transcriptional regulator [Pimelobacter simplex]|uniref:Transcriptional regulator, TetR family n=1 Tax=Nocardioides simplex TaxID=2045 RepID=A0A0A1DP37_NOCSI|nr:TetR/AcrR family transcriptional regulator [Pimelobacter simplex]AIY18387.1 Transcriptional regulator, TetR family [Pimelobacter simplex]MCG8153931.1 TetR family transcriptional regulator [Pimelobacter simplex]GEB16355.1 TetR family transcriptional regulator [Pimelobacter simplex]SFM35917.1 transcriptional regulator, TetR family [Pimelobacter simplex]